LAVGGRVCYLREGFFGTGGRAFRLDYEKGERGGVNGGKRTGLCWAEVSDKKTTYGEFWGTIRTPPFCRGGSGSMENLEKKEEGGAKKRGI